MSMFTIFTESSSERDILEQDFAHSHDRFHVKLQETPAIAGILRSISYQLFQATPPPLAQHITRMVIDSLHLKLSLALYREVLLSIKKKEQLLALYHQYFLSLAHIVGQQTTIQAISLPQLDEETSAIWGLQMLDPTPSDNQLITDFHEQLLQAAGKASQSSTILKTGKAAQEGINLNEFPARQKLDLTTKQILSKWEADDWKKRDDSSRQITRMQRKGRENLMQHSITALIAEETRLQREREEELARVYKKSEESICLKFKRLMRQKISQAKLKRKKK